MNLLPQVFRKLSSSRYTDRETETFEIIYHAASRVVNKWPMLMFTIPKPPHNPRLPLHVRRRPVRRRRAAIRR